MKILEVKTEGRRLGDFGERAAVRLLRKKGYKILERNYAPEDAEIDIIAAMDGTTVFVEVKTRRTDDERIAKIEPRPASAVTREKQDAIIGCAKIFLAYHRDTRARFDIIEVYATGDAPRWKIVDIKHLEGAFGKRGYR